MERIEPKLGELNPKTGKHAKFCGLDYCNLRHYANGYCVNHYQQYKRIGLVKPLIDFSKIEYGPCAFTGCRNKASTKIGNQLCQGHINHVQPSHQSFRGEPQELKYYMRDGMTENGRVCKVCNEEKPLDEFYDRNKHKGLDKTTKSTQCKECYIKDVGYYQGKRATKADGTDPKGYNGNPPGGDELVKVIPAKYPDYCRHCSESFNAGTMIVWVKKDDLYHYECYVQSRRDRMEGK